MLISGSQILSVGTLVGCPRDTFREPATSVFITIICYLPFLLSFSLNFLTYLLRCNRVNAKIVIRTQQSSMKPHIKKIYTMEFYSAIKKENFTLCNSMDGPGEHYARWNKPVRERQVPCDFIHVWNLMNKLS